MTHLEECQAIIEAYQAKWTQNPETRVAKMELADDSRYFMAQQYIQGYNDGRMAALESFAFQQ